MWDLNQTNSYLPVVQREATSPRGPRYHGGPSEELGPPHDTSRTTPCRSFWWSGKGWKLYQVACGSPAIWGSCWECSSPPLSSTSPRSKNQVFCKEEKHLKMSRRATVFFINCSLTWDTPESRGLFSHPLWSFRWFAWRFTLTWEHFLFSSMSGAFTEDYLDNLIPECCLEEWSPVEELYFLLQLSNSVVIVPGGEKLDTFVRFDINHSYHEHDVSVFPQVLNTFLPGNM